MTFIHAEWEFFWTLWIGTLEIRFINIIIILSWCWLEPSVCLMPCKIEIVSNFMGVVWWKTQIFGHSTSWAPFEKRYMLKLGPNDTIILKVYNYETLFYYHLEWPFMIVFSSGLWYLLFLLNWSKYYVFLVFCIWVQYLIFLFYFSIPFSSNLI